MKCVTATPSHQPCVSVCLGMYVFICSSVCLCESVYVFLCRRVWTWRGHMSVNEACLSVGRTERIQPFTARCPRQRQSVCWCQHDHHRCWGQHANRCRCRVSFRHSAGGHLYVFCHFYVLSCSAYSRIEELLREKGKMSDGEGMRAVLLVPTPLQSYYEHCNYVA